MTTPDRGGQGNSGAPVARGGLFGIYQDMDRRIPQVLWEISGAEGFLQPPGLRCEKCDPTLPLAEGPEPLHGDGIVLVGDAAGLVDPFWGHGIDSAMVSGKLAAGAIVAALGGGATRERALQDYTDAVSARFAATWQSHLLLREQVATFHSLLGFTPPELLRRLLGVRSAAVEPL